MSYDKFVGYYIIGTLSQNDAEQGKGLILWLPYKPNRFLRFLNKSLLGIRWVDKEDYKPELVSEPETVVEMPKRRSYKNESSKQERGNSKTSSSKK